MFRETRFSGDVYQQTELVPVCLHQPQPLLKPLESFLLLDSLGEGGRVILQHHHQLLPKILILSQFVSRQCTDLASETESLKL